MSLEKTAFIGFDTGATHVAFEKLLARYINVRDAAASVLHGERNVPNELWPYIALLSVSYAFNIYKAIGLILPELYHECGAVLLRQLWEVSLNLHWIEKEPKTRAGDFCNYSVMEFRKTMQKTGDAEAVGGFDDATERFQKQFHFQDKRGRRRTHVTFATKTVEERAAELGESWAQDYKLLYYLASMHAHGSPGAILHQHFVPHTSDPKKKEQDSTGLVAYLAMKVLVDDIRLLVRQEFVSQCTAVDQAFEGAASELKT